MTDQNDTLQVEAPKNEEVDFLRELIEKTNKYSQGTKREKTETDQPEEPVERPCIFKLPRELIQKIDQTYFVPQIVSIGPYHNISHENIRDDPKVRYLSSFCENKISLQDLEGELHIPRTIRNHALKNSSQEGNPCNIPLRMAAGFHDFHPFGPSTVQRPESRNPHLPGQPEKPPGPGSTPSDDRMDGIQMGSIRSSGPDCLRKQSVPTSHDAAENNSLDLRVYIDGITEIEAKAKNCYERVESIGSSNKFVAMMIRDGCFILELFLRCNSWKRFEPEDPIQRRLWASSALYRDLLLLENQIPFFVLTKLFTTSLDENLREYSEEILINLSLQFFNKVMRRTHEAVKWHRRENYKNLPLHLLDLIRSSFTTPLQKLPMDNIPSFLRRLCAGNGRVNPGNRCTSIPCVRKLLRAGIEVKPSYAESFLVVNFKKGVIHMPNISIDDVMSSFLVNCVGFEQCQPDMPKYFMRYTAFLDFLLNTKDDVDLLYERKVIEHTFETDEKLATYINALGKDLLFGFDNSYVSQQEDFDNLSKMFNEINTHYSSGIRWKWADFKREYCNKPWLLISALVALVYLLLTFGQTFTAIYAYVHPKK